MATKANDAALVEITALAMSKATPWPVFWGVCRAQGWRPGKEVTAAEYNTACAAFLKSPMGGAPNVK